MTRTGLHALTLYYTELRVLPSKANDYRRLPSPPHRYSENPISSQQLQTLQSGAPPGHALVADFHIEGACETPHIEKGRPP